MAVRRQRKANKCSFSILFCLPNLKAERQKGRQTKRGINKAIRQFKRDDRKRGLDEERTEMLDAAVKERDRLRQAGQDAKDKKAEDKMIENKVENNKNEDNKADYNKAEDNKADDNKEEEITKL